MKKRAPIFLPLLFLAVSLLTRGVSADYTQWVDAPGCAQLGLCPAPTQEDGYMNWHERTFLHLLNVARLEPPLYQKKYGLEDFGCGVLDFLPPLYFEENLCYPAKIHALQMAKDPDCFKEETCTDCEKFGDCSAKSRIRKFDHGEGQVQLIASGSPVDALNSLLAREYTCMLLMSGRFHEAGIGHASGAKEYWSVVLGKNSDYRNRVAVVSGTHSIAPSGVVFSSSLIDFRLDEGLKESLLFIDEEVYHLSLDTTVFTMVEGRGRTGIYEATVPLQDLGLFTTQERKDPRSGCHYYYFHFRTEHTSTVFRLPEHGYYFLTGFEGCRSTFSQFQPQTPYNERMQEQRRAQAEEFNKISDEKRRRRREERERLVQEKEASDRNRKLFWGFLFFMALVLYARRRSFRGLRRWF